MRRRTFLSRAALGAAGTVGASRLWLPSPALASAPGLLPGIDAAPGAGDPALKALAAAALDAAKQAGATYADVRFTKTRILGFGLQRRTLHTLSDSESVAVGVRVLVNDAWGFASGPSWAVDDLVRLAGASAAQAHVNHWATTQPVSMGAVPPVINGSWTTPIKVDPFAVPLQDQVALLFAAHNTVMDKAKLNNVASNVQWQREERTFASSEGSYLTQVIYLSMANTSSAIAVDGDKRRGTAGVSGLGARTGGYEVFTDAKLNEQLPRVFDEAQTAANAPEPTEVEVGRYDLVVSAEMMSWIVDQTVGQALQLDRALGFEANVGGTSYLAPPSEMLGAMKLAPDFVTVTANRSQPGGAATVKWDDEGVEPVDYAMIENGVVTDYATTRQQAAWLSDWYAHQHQPVRSHGNAGAPDAFYETMQHMPNVVLQPGTANVGFDDLVAGVEQGIAITGGRVMFDQQLLNGEGSPERAFEIVKGKLGRQLKNVSLQVRAPQFWKSVAALGGAASADTFEAQSGKGDPRQILLHSVTAVPARVNQVNIVNLGLRT